MVISISLCRRRLDALSNCATGVSLFSTVVEGKRAWKSLEVICSNRCDLFTLSAIPYFITYRLELRQKDITAVEK